MFVEVLVGVVEPAHGLIIVAIYPFFGLQPSGPARGGATDDDPCPRKSPSPVCSRETRR